MNKKNIRLIGDTARISAGIFFFITMVWREDKYWWFSFTAMIIFALIGFLSFIKDSNVDHNKPEINHNNKNTHGWGRGYAKRNDRTHDKNATGEKDE